MSTPSSPVPSSQSSSHATTVFSQGPPSHNTRSSVVNRVVQNSVPLATYLSAFTQGNLNKSVASTNRSRPPTPHQSDNLSSPNGSRLHRLTLPSVSRSSPRSIPQLSLHTPVPPPSHSTSGTTYSPLSVSRSSVSLTTTCYQIM
jgi:hypothetical protein